MYNTILFVVMNFKDPPTNPTRQDYNRGNISVYINWKCADCAVSLEVIMYL